VFSALRSYNECTFSCGKTSAPKAKPRATQNRNTSLQYMGMHKFPRHLSIAAPDKNSLHGSAMMDISSYFIYSMVSRYSAFLANWDIGYILIQVKLNQNEASESEIDMMPQNMLVSGWMGIQLI